jgi:hypothetical protein
MNRHISLNGLKGVAEGKARGRKASHDWIAEREHLADMLADGHSVASIAKHYNVVPLTIYRVLASLNLSTINQLVVKSLRESHHAV